jgi:hypothetical protein
MSLLDNAVCRKCGQEEESSCHILCQCPALALVFSYEWVELIHILAGLKKKKFLTLAKRTKLLKGIQWTLWGI